MASRLNHPHEPLQTQRLPLELILGILECAARTWIDVHPRWTASLQLVSRAAKTAIEPIVYHVFVVRRKGIDRSDTNIQRASRLAQILANGVVPHIHHLIIGVDALDIIRGSPSTLSIPRLSIISLQWVRPSEYLSKPFTITGTKVELLRHGSLLVSCTSTLRSTEERVRFWGTTETRHDFSSAYNFLTLDASSMSKDPSTAVTGGSRWFYLELGEMKLDTLVLDDIVDILTSRRPDLRDAHVVIVAPVNYISPCGLGVDETVHLLDVHHKFAEIRKQKEHWRVPITLDLNDSQALRWSKLDPELLYSRVHVSHVLWGLDDQGWPGLCYGRAVERGNAWDEGRLLRRPVASALES